VLKQIGDPLRVTDISLPARHSLEMLSVDHRYVELRLEKVIHRLPI
jgi:hypothetical protein